MTTRWWIIVIVIGGGIIIREPSLDIGLFDVHNLFSSSKRQYETRGVVVRVCCLAKWQLLTWASNCVHTLVFYLLNSTNKNTHTYHSVWLVWFTMLRCCGPIECLVFPQVFCLSLSLPRYVVLGGLLFENNGFWLFWPRRTQRSFDFVWLQLLVLHKSKSNCWVDWHRHTRW